ncbi:MAG TPA: response regulator [Gemmatimonadaceae bacterium]|nr:response regulator [Gemmatimonadaceae bacterium]
MPFSDEIQPLEAHLEREMRAFFAKRLADESSLSELVHVILAGIAAVLSWGWVPHHEALLWVAAVTVASLGRAFLRQRAVRQDPYSPQVVRAVRTGVAMLGVAWGVGVLLVAPDLPLQQLAWITVMFAGLIAGATASLLPDKTAFYTLEITLLVPLMVALGMNETTSSHVAGISVMLLFGATMAAFYSRAHNALTHHFRVQKRLELTERAAVDAMRVARDAAQKANSAKSAFLANTSHEIRTPLNGILGMVDVLLDSELSDAQRRNAELIAESGETLLSTINDLLDLSKIEASQLDLERTTFDLHQLLHSCVRLFMPKATAAGIELVSDVQPDVPQHVIGDPHRLRQVLSNLVGNAVKFTARGEVLLVARVTQRGDENVGVRFSVRDTGIGIPQEHLDKVFEPFRQVDTSTTRHYGGTGLGLSISRRLVDLMGGKLTVESTYGAGSEFAFVVELPVAHGPRDTIDASHGNLRGVRVLVVDDHAVNRRVIVESLRWAQCDVAEASSVADALASVRAARRRQQPIRLVVSDVQMPERDGFSLAEELRNASELQETRIMLLTSAGQRGDGERCRKLGVAAYLQKPVTRVELLDAAAAAVADPKAKRRPSLITRHIIEETRRRLRVLVAEDNPINQEVAQVMLRKRGHVVTVVEDGALAVTAVANEMFDIVLMDVQMPTMDGIEATRRIRQDHPRLPIIALTASVSSEEKDRCLSAGMTGYLTKPFKPHELFATIEGIEVGDGAAVAEILDAPVNLKGFRAMLAEAGIESAGDAMLRVFLEDAVKRVSTLRDAVSSNDLQGIRRAAHGIKSGAGNIRADILAALLGELEDAAAEANTQAIASLMPRVDQEYARVVDVLDGQLGAAAASD